MREQLAAESRRVEDAETELKRTEERLEGVRAEAESRADSERARAEQALKQHAELSAAAEHALAQESAPAGDDGDDAGAQARKHAVQLQASEGQARDPHSTPRDSERSPLPRRWEVAG